MRVVYIKELNYTDLPIGGTPIFVGDAILTFVSQAPYLIVNAYQKHLDYGTSVLPYKDDKFMKLELHCTIARGESAVVLTHSKETANKICEEIKVEFPEKIVKIYTGETPVDIKRNDFRDVNKTWEDVDVVIYNSTCESGISCVLEKFGKVFAFFKRDILCVQSSFQMIGRIRAMKRLHLHIEGRVLSGPPLPLDFEGVLARYCASRRSIPPGVVSALTPTEDGWEFTDTPFAKVVFANARHKNASKNAFGFLFIDLCKKSGMIIEEMEESTTEKDTVLEEAVEIRLAEMKEHRAEEIADAVNISQGDVDMLNSVRKKTQGQMDSLQKYYLGATYKVPTNSINSAFVLAYDNPDVKRAYKGQCMLRKYGYDVPSSIENMKLELTPATDARFKEDMTLLQKRIPKTFDKQILFRGWHEISEESRKHQYVQDLLNLVTGLPGVHVAGKSVHGTVADIRIRLRLGYVIKYGPNGGVLRNKGSKGCVSAEVVQKLQKIRDDICGQYPECRINQFVEGAVDLKRVVSTLNGVLEHVYGCSFKRATDKRGGAFVLSQSDLFCDEGTGVVVLPTWRGSKRKNCIESHIQPRQPAAPECQVQFRPVGVPRREIVQQPELDAVRSRTTPALPIRVIAVDNEGIAAEEVCVHRERVALFDTVVQERRDKAAAERMKANEIREQAKIAKQQKYDADELEYQAGVRRQRVEDEEARLAPLIAREKERQTACLKRAEQRKLKESEQQKAPRVETLLPTPAPIFEQVPERQRLLDHFRKLPCHIPRRMVYKHVKNWEAAKDTCFCKTLKECWRHQHFTHEQQMEICHELNGLGGSPYCAKMGELEAKFTILYDMRRAEGPRDDREWSDWCEKKDKAISAATREKAAQVERGKLDSYYGF
jgi:hypothetical protein